MSIEPDFNDTKKIRFAFFINLVFTIIEFIGGFLTNSIAIISDAVHDLGDTLSLGLAWHFQNKAKQGRDLKFSYGYKRFSILGAVINSVILIIGAIFIFYNAIPRIINPQEVDALGMFYLSILGIIVNFWAYYKLRKGKSLNEQVVGLHMLEDVLGWVAVLIGSLIMYFKGGWHWIDAVLSLFIACFILFNVYKKLRASFKIILQAIPEDVDFQLVQKTLLEIENVKDIHDLHVWTLDGDRNILTVHIVVSPSLPLSEMKDIKSKARAAMEDLDISHCTFEIEGEFEDCGYDKSG